MLRPVSRRILTSLPSNSLAPSQMSLVGQGAILGQLFSGIAFLAQRLTSQGPGRREASHAMWDEVVVGQDGVLNERRKLACEKPGKMAF